MTRAGTPGTPRPDPTGDERATMLARLEYGLNPIDDGRRDATYRETPETLHADRLRRTRQALAEGRVLIAPLGTPPPLGDDLAGPPWTEAPLRVRTITAAVLHMADGRHVSVPPELIDLPDTDALRRQRLVASMHGRPTPERTTRVLDLPEYRRPVQGAVLRDAILTAYGFDPHHPCTPTGGTP